MSYTPIPHKSCLLIAFALRLALALAAIRCIFRDNPTVAMSFRKAMVYPCFLPHQRKDSLDRRRLVQRATPCRNQSK